MTISMATAIEKIGTDIELPERKGVSPRMEFTIPFDRPILPDSITKSSVYVLDSSGKRIDVFRELSIDGKSIKIMPVEPYEEGMTYVLWIKNSLRYEASGNLNNNMFMKFTIAEAVDELPTVGSYENLKSILERSMTNGFPLYGLYLRNGMSSDKNTSTKESAASTDAGEEYSATNTQVSGVDEADIIKTDGKYIYQISGSRLIISEVYPDDNMKVIESMDLQADMSGPLELYADEKYLTVIGINRANIRMEPDRTDINHRPYYNSYVTKMIVFDITDKSNIQQIRDVELEGTYLSSRKIDSHIYLVANRYIDCYRLLYEKNINDTPSYRDTAVAKGFINIDYNSIRYFPGSVEPNYLITAAVDLDNESRGASISAYLGAGQCIYASRNNIYIAISKYGYNDYIGITELSEAKKDKEKPKLIEETTEIYRLAINGARLDYTGKAQVPGRILNQFSMDEYNNSFRIATTTGNMWGIAGGVSSNNLYVLDHNMKIIGSIEDIAPGEQIYSVRFMGDRAYMVTFKTVDPLFVIDLKEPEKPLILGELKIPGYSDYLHPYDENHIIGFGKDTVELTHKNEKGEIIRTNAYYLGMKAALFDVTDVSKPVEKFSIKIGDRGTDSELLSNHKALLFSREKKLLAFPINVMEVKGSKFDKNGMPYYGELAFDGVYVYSLDTENGFKLKGTISHIEAQDYSDSGKYWNGCDKSIKRILYIEDNLYTVSDSMIMVHDMEALSYRSSLELK